MVESEDSCFWNGSLSSLWCRQHYLLRLREGRWGEFEGEQRIFETSSLEKESKSRPGTAWGWVEVIGTNWERPRSWWISPAAENSSLTCPSWGLWWGVFEEFLESQVSVESMKCKEQSIMNETLIFDTFTGVLCCRVKIRSDVTEVCEALRSFSEWPQTAVLFLFQFLSAFLYYFCLLPFCFLPCCQLFCPIAVCMKVSISPTPWTFQHLELSHLWNQAAGLKIRQPHLLKLCAK